jgi:hypothetical protein
MHTLKWYNQTKNFKENFSTRFRATQIKQCGASGVVAMTEEKNYKLILLYWFFHIQAVAVITFIPQECVNGTSAVSSVP